MKAEITKTPVAKTEMLIRKPVAGLTAFLEHGIKLNLVADKNPDAHKPGWRQA